MGHKVYISFKAEDMAFKEAVGDLPNIDYIDKSLTAPIPSQDQDYIMRRIRQDYLYDSTVTIFLIGQYGAENRGESEQYFIKKELQASLSSTEVHGKSGILGVVLPTAQSEVYRGSIPCWQCGNPHQVVTVDDSTVVREFSYNFYLPYDGCSSTEDDRYCVLAPWDSFALDPNRWIDQAFAKRFEPIANKTRVRP